MNVDATLSVATFELVGHVLTLGYAVMAAALLYFWLTKNTVMPRYRMSSVLSVVVMASALLLLYAQKQSWSAAYAFDGVNYVLRDGAALFTNGYRYLNWLIDVPMLLIQILFVAAIAGAAFRKYVYQFSFAGVLMILTGYVGQFYEPGRETENVAAWLIWALVSTGFFVWVLVLITRVINEGKANMADSQARGIFGAILPLFYFAWMLYPLAYVTPILMTWGVAEYEFVIAAQQITYTVADIASKVIYGAMLSISATILSREQGFIEAD
jgi:bacteriorhodopsin